MRPVDENNGWQMRIVYKISKLCHYVCLTGYWSKVTVYNNDDNNDNNNNNDNDNNNDDNNDNNNNNDNNAFQV